MQYKLLILLDASSAPPNPKNPPLSTQSAERSSGYKQDELEAINAPQTIFDVTSKILYCVIEFNQCELNSFTLNNRINACANKNEIYSDAREKKNLSLLAD